MSAASSSRLKSKGNKVRIQARQNPASEQKRQDPDKSEDLENEEHEPQNQSEQDPDIEMDSEPDEKLASSNEPRPAKKLRTLEAKPTNPPPFEGMNRANVDIWLFEVEQYFELVELPANQRVSWAGTLLRESAASWWRSVVIEAKKNQPEASTADLFSWLEFKNLIRKRFQPVEASKTARSRMMALKQFKFGANAIEAYNAEFQKLVALTTDMAVQDQLTYYIKGLHEQVAHDVSLANPDSLDEAMALASRSSDIHSTSGGATAAWNRGSNNYKAGRRRYNYSSNQENSRASSSLTSSSSSNYNLNLIRGPNPNYTSNSLASYQGQSRSVSLKNGEGNTQIDEELNFINKSAPKGSEGFRPNSYLNEEEWRKCRQENRCFRCKRVGHQASACRAKLPINQPNSYPMTTQTFPLNSSARR